MPALCSSEALRGAPQIIGDIIALRLGDGTPVAYRNACPHMGIELDWEAARLLSRDGKWLRCTGHGALFRPEDGFCVAGPCRGDRLQAIALREADGWVIADG